MRDVGWHPPGVLPLILGSAPPDATSEPEGHPANVGGLVAEYRIEGDRHTQMAMRAAREPDRRRHFNVWETDEMGREQLVDVRERLPDGTSRSITKRNRDA